ncbi:dynein heavy chain-like protein 2 isoform X2 [Neocloeon triangulifer]|uniref:dynein heavy chain-like protein 2 isoform X2 n=1 Tax=Neocloeon triangulifer TaxID=2078957 RepID=UPI00286EE51B|nr:dynein heavy chain-like protein 2 isoform X2 [Neocloeon triangulifer]
MRRSKAKDGGDTENLDSGYHGAKRMSQMSNDSIESMMMHIIEKERDAVLSEIESMCPPENNNNNELENPPKKSYDEKFYAESAEHEDLKAMEPIMETQEEEKTENSEAANDEAKDEERLNETAEAEAATVEQSDERNEETESTAGENVGKARQEKMEQSPPTVVVNKAEGEENGGSLEAAQNDEDGSSELLFDLSAEDVEMLEAQLRELSVLSPDPAVAENALDAATANSQPEGPTAQSAKEETRAEA